MYLPLEMTLTCRIHTMNGDNDKLCAIWNKDVIKDMYIYSSYL